VVVEEVSVADLHALGPDVVLIDVRENDEWVDGHIPYARHVVLGTVPDHLDRFDGTPTYVICKVGARSLWACEFAAARGHHVANVTGGMLGWRSAGFDVATGSDVVDA
jgi:rhodanese-related sulfurtransferase